MIYFIYCFGFFLNNEKIALPVEKKINDIDRNNNNDNLKGIKDTNTDKQQFSDDANNILINPKPIVSSLPKPIVIDSNLVTIKDNDLNEISSKEATEPEKIQNVDNDKLLVDFLKLNEIMICRGIYKRSPIKPGVEFINNVDSLFCYTKISNSGVKQEVKHVWYFENKEMTTVSYNIKTSYNYRSWSKKTIYPNQTGKWRVDVINKSGDLLGSRDFTINSINNTY